MHSSHPYVDTASFSAAFNLSSADGVALAHTLRLQQDGFNERFSLHVGLDKGSQEMPLAVPQIMIRINDTHNLACNSRGFPVPDFLDDAKSQNFVEHLSRWFVTDHAVPQTLAHLFQVISAHARPDMAQPLEKNPRARRTCAFRF